MRSLFIAGLVGLTISVFATERVWTGTAGDWKWSTPANWSGSAAPASGDSVIITLSTAITVTNDISGLSLSGLVISNTAAATIAGQTITLTAGAFITAVGTTLSLYTPFGGSGTILKDGTGSLVLYGASSGFAGNWALTNGHTTVRNSLAFGPSAPVTVYGNTAADTCSLRMDAEGTYANPITLYKGSTQVYYSYKTITNSAPITCYGQTRIMAAPGSMFLRGGLLSPDNTGFIFNSGSSKVVIENTPPNLGTAPFYFDAGLVDLGVAGTWGSMLVAKGTLRTTAENVLGTIGAVRIGTGYGLFGTLDMNGYNQTVNGVWSDTAVDAGGNPRRITSTASALLESITTATQTFNGTVDGVVSFRMSGTGRQNFDKGVSTTRGELVCARGQLGLNSGAQFTALSALVVTNTGRLIVTSPSVNPGLVRVRIADSGILDIGSGVQVEAFDAQVNGVYLQPGVYTSGNLSPTLSGLGSLKVLTAGTVQPSGQFIWNGAGADTSMRTSGNWVGAVAPSFNRAETLVFSDGTATASLTGEVDVYAFNFRTNANFTLSAGDSTAKINLGAGGLVISNQIATAVAYQIAPTLSLAAPQFWQMHTNTSTLTLAGPIVGGNTNWNWIVSGVSALYLNGDNTFESPLIVSNGCLQINSDTALGSPIRPVTVIGDSPKAFNHLRFNGAVRTNNVPLMLGNYIGPLLGGGQTLVLNGKVSAISSSGDAHIIVPGTMIVRGGLDATLARFWLQVSPGGTLIVENNPMLFGPNDAPQDDSGTVCLKTTNNTWKTYNVYGGTLLCGTTNVLVSTVSFGASWKRSGTLNLNGFNQRIDALRSGTTADLAANYCVTSPTPAVLTISPATNIINFSGYFAGEAAFLHAVTGTFTFDALPSTTKGPLRVSSGTVAFTGGAGWLGSTNVFVSGTGTLRVQAASAGVAFGTAATGWKTHLILSDSAKLQLDAGTGEKVKFLQINGVEMPRGTYGMTGSGARFIDDTHFTGPGLLTVLSQNIIGTFLILK